VLIHSAAELGQSFADVGLSVYKCWRGLSLQPNILSQSDVTQTSTPLKTGGVVAAAVSSLLAISHSTLVGQNVQVLSMLRGLSTLAEQLVMSPTACVCIDSQGLFSVLADVSYNYAMSNNFLYFRRTHELPFNHACY